MKKKEFPSAKEQRESVHLMECAVKDLLKYEAYPKWKDINIGDIALFAYEKEDVFAHLLIGKDIIKIGVLDKKEIEKYLVFFKQKHRNLFFGYVTRKDDDKPHDNRLNVSIRIIKGPMKN